jgi:FemAB-related protein (PEP-CTERM system-associated)
MTMNVLQLTPGWEKAWERFLDGSPEATLGHLLGWRNVVEKTYHHTPYYLMAVDGQAVAGVLPLFVISSPLFGRFLVTAPYLSYGGLLTDSESAGDALIQVAREVAVEQRAKYIEIRGLSKVGRGLLPKEKYCTLVLPLSAGPNVLWERFEGRTRRAVRKALKSGLRVETGHHLRAVFADVMSRHMRDLGTPFHRARFYQSIAEELPGQSEILMARLGDRYVGGILVVACQRTVYWLYGAALRAYKGVAATSLLIWEAIRWACERGMAYFDFGRSRWGSGTFVFKQQWRALPAPLFYEYSLANGGHVPDMDPTNARFQFAIALWKQLPVSAAKALGPWIIRDIP